jgi:hypothetical protein
MTTKNTSPWKKIKIFISYKIFDFGHLQVPIKNSENTVGNMWYKISRDKGKSE